MEIDLWEGFDVFFLQSVICMWDSRLITDSLRDTTRRWFIPFGKGVNKYPVLLPRRAGCGVVNSLRGGPRGLGD
jgi:hypothetical protein